MAKSFATTTISLFLLSSGLVPVLAHRGNVRLRRGEYPSGEAYTWLPLDQIHSTPDSYVSNTLPVSSSYDAGAQPTLASAPPLPQATLDIAAYPELDVIPPTDSPEVKQWVDAIDWDLIPKIDPTQPGDCAPGKDAYNLRGADGNCWWTCGQCTRDVDISTCANFMDYGHTYDDGPARYTTKLLTYLEAKGQHATFFLIGSRIRERPEVVRYEYMTGHELGVHTWSHARGLTTMTNEEIVAELGWTRKIIYDVIGVTPKLMRPPQGDIDDRVRAISLAMGMIPVLWTGLTDEQTGLEITWDSNDWRVHDGGNATEIQHTWEGVLDSTTQFTDHGIVALQHDKAPETVDLAIGYTLPFVENHNPPFSIKPVMQCQNRPYGDIFEETNTNKDNPAFGTDDVATRRSNLGYAASHGQATSVSLTVSRTYASGPTGTGTGTTQQTSSTGGGGGGAPNAALHSSSGSSFGILSAVLLVTYMFSM